LRPTGENKLQRRFAGAAKTGHGNLILEEGTLDAACLARVVANPTYATVI